MAVNDIKGYYKALGLASGASIEEVKKAYKKLQVELHPSGAIRRKMRASPEYDKLSEQQKEAKEKELNERISVVNEAYNVLGFEDKKAEYDSGTGQYSAFPGMDGGFGFPFDIFRNAAGGGQSRKEYKVKDTMTEIKLSMKDVYAGKQSKFRIKTRKICQKCSGKGGENVTKCATCGGRGRVFVQKNMGIIMARTEVDCRACGGSGEVIKGATCTDCTGEKVVTVSEVVDVTIKPGINNGEAIVMKGKGNQLPGCVNGDLVFVCTVIPNDKYSRVDNHLLSTVDIDLLTVISGGTVYFEHLDGRKLAVQVAPFKKFDEAVRVSGEGFRRDGSRGDLILRPNVLINSNLDRSKLSEYIKPIISKPYGEFQNHPSSFCKVPSASQKQQACDSSEDDFANFDVRDPFRGFGLF